MSFSLVEEYENAVVIAGLKAQESGVPKHEAFLESILDFYDDTGLLYPVFQGLEFMPEVKKKLSLMEEMSITYLMKALVSKKSYV